MIEVWQSEVRFLHPQWSPPDVNVSQSLCFFQHFCAMYFWTWMIRTVNSWANRTKGNQQFPLKTSHMQRRNMLAVNRRKKKKRMSDAENVYILLFKFNGIAVKFVCRVSRVCLFFVSAQVLIVSCLFRSSLVSSAPACVQMAQAIFKAVHIGERKKKTTTTRH